MNPSIAVRIFALSLFLVSCGTSEVPVTAPGLTPPPATLLATATPRPDPTAIKPATATKEPTKKATQESTKEPDKTATAETPISIESIRRNDITMTADRLSIIDSFGNLAGERPAVVAEGKVVFVDWTDDKPLSWVKTESPTNYAKAMRYVQAVMCAGNKITLPDTMDEAIALPEIVAKLTTGCDVNIHAVAQDAYLDDPGYSIPEQKFKIDNNTLFIIRQVTGTQAKTDKKVWSTMATYKYAGAGAGAGWGGVSVLPDEKHNIVNITITNNGVWIPKDATLQDWLSYRTFWSIDRRAKKSYSSFIDSSTDLDYPLKAMLKIKDNQYSFPPKWVMR